MSDEAHDRDEHGDDTDDEPVAADATTADDDEGEIGERNVGGP
jgi:hypothetical protein